MYCIFCTNDVNGSFRTLSSIQNVIFETHFGLSHHLHCAKAYTLYIHTSVCEYTTYNNFCFFFFSYEICLSYQIGYLLRLAGTGTSVRVRCNLFIYFFLSYLPTSATVNAQPVKKDIRTETHILHSLRVIYGQSIIYVFVENEREIVLILNQ